MTFVPGDIVESLGHVGSTLGERWTILTGPTPFFIPARGATESRYVVLRANGRFSHCDAAFLERHFKKE